MKGHRVEGKAGHDPIAGAAIRYDLDVGRRFELPEPQHEPVPAGALEHPLAERPPYREPLPRRQLAPRGVAWNAFHRASPRGRTRSVHGEGHTREVRVDRGRATVDQLEPGLESPAFSHRESIRNHEELDVEG